MGNSRESLLQEFVDWATDHVRGDEKGEAQIFLDHLFRAFGQKGSLDVGGTPDFGIDINPFAVELAKVTLMIGRKLAIDELHIADEKDLPLDNLDKNFHAGDALAGPNATQAPWPAVDVIIGNPPFLGAKRLKPERGPDYVKLLRKLYPDVPGMADYCVYWFRRAHDHMPACTKDDPFAGRAGLVGTQNIRNNQSRVGGLDHIRPSNLLQVFAFEDDYTFGVLQSRVHWTWFVQQSSKLKSDFRFGENIWNTFPWPQSPTKKQIDAVASAAVAVRQVRAAALQQIEGGLRALYRTLELPGKNPLKDAHAALDSAVLAAYGFDPKKDLLGQLLALNLAVSQREKAGESVTPPGVPSIFGDPARLITDDCIRP